MFFNSVKCTICGAKVKGNANHCGECGTKIDKEKTNCKHCGGETTVGKFCSLCGESLLHTATPEFTNMLWQRGASDIAARIAIKDISGFLNKRVGVTEGTRALFFQGGRFFGDLGPGTHEVANICQQLTTKETAYLVYFDTSDINLTFQYPKVLTSDPTEISVGFTLVVRFEDIRNFYTNYVKDRSQVVLAELQDSFTREINDIVESIVSGESIKSFTPKGDFTKKLEHKLRSGLREGFGRIGLALIRISNLDYKSVTGEKIIEIRKETFEDWEINEARLEQFKQMMEIEDKKGTAELAKAYNDLNLAEKRAVLQDRLDKHLTNEKIRDFKNSKEYELFLRKLENEFARDEVGYEKEEVGRAKEKLISDDEMRDLVWAFEEKGEDHEIFRKHTLARVKFENELESEKRKALSTIELIGEKRALEQGIKTDFLEKELYAELKEKRTRFEHTQREDWDKWQSKKKHEKEKAELDLEMAKIQKEKEILISDTILAEKEKKMRLGQLGLREMSITEKLDELNKLEVQQAKDEHRLKVQRREQELAHQQRMDDLAARIKEATELTKVKIDEEKARAEIEIKKEKVRSEEEIKRIEALSKVSLETLISVSDSDRAVLLKDLASTRALQGFSEEQILAMNAKESPHIAEALKEKYARVGSDKVEEMYKMMLGEKDKVAAEKDKSATEARQMYENFSKMMKETFEKALETQRDTSIAAAQGMRGTFETAIETQRDTAVATTQGARPNVIATPAGTQMTVMSAGVGAGISAGQPQVEKKEPAQPQVVCQKCSWMMEAGPKYCQNCGNKMFD